MSTETQEMQCIDHLRRPHVRRLIEEVIHSVIPSFYAEEAAACVADALHGAGYALIQTQDKEA